jgi:hypothetical protein
VVNPAYAKVYPWENVDQQAREAEWRHYGGALGDGVVGAPRADGSSAFSLIPSTSDRSFQVNLADYRMRGIMFQPTQDTWTGTSTAPPAGQTRADRLLMSLNPTTKQITLRVQEGVPATPPTAPSRPGFTRASAGVWEIPLWLWTGGNVAANALAYEDHRIWLGDIMHGNEPPAPWGGNTELNQGRPDGSRFYHLPTGQEYVQTYPGGIPTWSSLDDPPWSALDIGAGTMVTGQARPEYRVRRGQVELQGHGLHAGGSLWGPQSTLLEVLVARVPAGLAPTVPHHWAGRISGGGGANYVGVAPLYVTPEGEVRVTLYAGMSMAGIWYDPIRYTPKR